jgi:hypothetical protein
VLAAAGVIDGERAGREHVWSMNPSKLAQAMRQLEVMSRGWDNSLERLKAHLEKG